MHTYTESYIPAHTYTPTCTHTCMHMPALTHAHTHAHIILKTRPSKHAPTAPRRKKAASAERRSEATSTMIAQRSACGRPDGRYLLTRRTDLVTKTLRAMPSRRTGTLHSACCGDLASFRRLLAADDTIINLLSTAIDRPHGLAQSPSPSPRL